MNAKEAGLFTLAWTATFLRTSKKFIRRHPDLKDVFEGVIQQLERDPHQARLCLHPLKGRHLGKHAARVTYEHRIVLFLRLAKKEIVLLDVGTHDEV